MLAKYLPKISDLFIKQGIKTHTMSDICGHLRISKKTLYQHVDNKKDLVNKSMFWILSKDEKEIIEIEKGEGNAIDKIYMINHKVYHKLKNLRPSIFQDLRNHFPKAWQLFSVHNDVFVTNSIKRNLKEGVDEGLFRDDMNIDIVARINVTLINSMLESKLYSKEKYSFTDIYQEITKYHLGGICNPNGIEYLNNLLEQKSKSV